MAEKNRNAGQESELFRMWFRHTGMSEPDETWRENGTGKNLDKNYSVEQIISEVGDQTITHLLLTGSYLPDISKFAPQLTHLCIRPPLKTEIQVVSRSDGLLSKLSKAKPVQLKFPEGLIYLDMSDCGLTSLPPSVSFLDKLEVLDISNNKFKYYGLSDVFEAMTSLRELNISYCQLTSLPVLVSMLDNLEVLNISYNDFSSDDLTDAFVAMTSLKELQIMNSVHGSLPASVCMLDKLEVLNISHNNFSSDDLEYAFVAMTSLRDLDISWCQLTSLPVSVSMLNKLEVLDISYNDFSFDGLTDVFVAMTSLRELKIIKSRLRSIPVSVSFLDKLAVLNISYNDFSSDDLTDVFVAMISLRELNISECQLTSLPVSTSGLQELRYLDISSNNFITLPSCVYSLINLHTLDISFNKSLESLDPKILQLTKLLDFRLHICPALASPPFEVCNQGLEAIRQYYIDLVKGAGQNLPFVTIAVIGQTLAGKTSLIRTLQSPDKKRVLTNRGEDAVKDETTKVFNIEELEVHNTVLRLIDMGGQEIYHITYQLTLKHNCIPVIVVSMEQYSDISDESTKREAVRRLAFDWMSHLYLANPDLGPPKLIFTHKDKFDIAEFNTLRASFLDISNELCKEIVMEEKALASNVCGILHLADLTTPVFLSEDIYEVGKDDDYAVFDVIKRILFKASQGFVKPLPKVWEEVNKKILSLQAPFNTVDEILSALRKTDRSIKRKQLKIILTYMHDCGKVLWYRNVDLVRKYIFHKISEVTKLLCVLYNHNGEIWKDRLRTFQPYLDHHKRRVEKEDYESLVQEFLKTGIIDRNLLHYLIRRETAFTNGSGIKIALAVLQSFQLLHGPLQRDFDKICFIIPSFATVHHDTLNDECGDLTFQVDLLFKGLSLPRYVYHQMTVGLLELFPNHMDSPIVKSNGASVFNDGFNIQLIHDYKSRNASIQISSSTSDVCGLWDRLINTTNNTIKHILSTWPASRPVVISLCSHCMLTGNPHPEKTTNPEWCVTSLKTLPRQLKGLRQLNSQKGLRTVKCERDEVLSPFKYPCASLSATETEQFRNAVHQLKLKKKSATTSLDKQETPAESYTQSAHISTDDLSDLSDEDEYVSPRDDPAMVTIRLRVKPTTNKRIRQLFSNTDKVFKMTAVRGRALLINNKNFTDRPDICREGSDADVFNMVKMLKAFDFEVTSFSDLKAEDMLRVVKEEVHLKEQQDLGMFVLVIMSHGTENNCIFGTDLKQVNLKDVYDLLTPLNFPVMAGKPKLVILEVCSGDRIDVGKRGLHRDDQSQHAPPVDYEVVPPPPSQIGECQSATSMDWLNYDDLLIIKASFETFIAKIHPVYGSLMIRALVSTMYKHACHRDMYKIFKAVQSKVRKLCLTRELSCGQMVVAQDTLTHMRKLYLFPGYNGLRREQSPPSGT